MFETCTLDGCEKPRASAGYCRAHYERKRKTGDPGEPAMRNNPGAVQLWVREFIARDDFGDDCIEWPYAKTPAGYGVATWPTEDGGTGGLAPATHRVLVGVGRSRPNADSFALHSCDNPPCVNPNHLSWGDHRENVRQMHERGRGPDKKGERSARAVLTTADVVEARRLYRLGESDQIRLAEKFGVDSGTMSRAIRGESWSHLNDVSPPTTGSSRGRLSSAQRWIQNFIDRGEFGEDCVEWVYEASLGRGRVKWSTEEGGPGRRVPATHRVLDGVGRPRPSSGTQVINTCGNLLCVNPNHLVWCTPKPRKVTQPRWAHGEQTGAAKLTEEAVREARAIYASGESTYAELAERYGVSAPTMRSAISGKTWGHVEGAVTKRRDPTVRGKLTESAVREIRELYELGVCKQVELAERYGVSQITVSNIVRRKTWSHIE